MKTAPYQLLKLHILDFVGLSRDAIHMHIGFIALVVTILITRRKLSSRRVLVPGFFFSLLMEVMDFRDHYMAFANWNLFWDSLHDVLNTNFIPVCIVYLARFGIFRNGENPQP